MKNQITAMTIDLHMKPGRPITIGRKITSENCRYLNWKVTFPPSEEAYALPDCNFRLFSPFEKGGPFATVSIFRHADRSLQIEVYDHRLDLVVAKRTVHDNIKTGTFVDVTIDADCNVGWRYRSMPLGENFVFAGKTYTRAMIREYWPTFQETFRNRVANGGFDDVIREITTQTYWNPANDETVLEYLCFYYGHRYKLTWDKSHVEFTEPGFWRSVVIPEAPNDHRLEVIIYKPDDSPMVYLANPTTMAVELKMSRNQILEAKKRG